MSRVSLTLIAVLAGALGAPVGILLEPTAAIALARPASGTTPNNKPARPAKAAPAPLPMVFFVAKGEAHACGPNCDEWIAADGAIDLGTPQRLRTLLNRLGKRKLPIYFHSPGGSVTGALAMGRLMRERGLTAGVGWTVPRGCDPKEARQETCDKLKRAGRDLPATLDTSRTMCNSACVYALVGAAVRDIAPGVGLGIHSSSFRFMDGGGHASLRPPPQLVRAAVKASYDRIASYLGEMGIDPALVRAARKIEHDRVRFLSRGEIWRFNIDRRTLLEGEWKIIEEQPPSVRKIFLSELKAGQADYRTTLIRLTCGVADKLRLDFAREVADDDEPAAAIRVSAGVESYMLKPGHRAVLQSSKVEYDISTGYVPLTFFRHAVPSVTISAVSDESAGQPPNASEGAVNLSTVGLAPALSTLVSLCPNAADYLKVSAPTSANP